jgi:Zn-dependent protease with chaperone function
MFQNIKSKAISAAKMTARITADAVNFAAPGVITGGAVLVATAPSMLGIALISTQLLLAIVIMMLVLGFTVAIVKYAMEKDMANALYGMMPPSAT